MKFGVLQFFSWPGRRGDLKDVYDRALERVHIMDQNGYDAVWIAEHHFSTYSVCPSIHMMGVQFAAHTQNLRIGTGVSLAAFYNPVRLAEEVALLDVLSGGRVNWGAGSGFDPTEFRVFGIDRQDKHPRFRENVDIVLKAWGNERLDYDGEFHQYKDVEVLPKPLQNPIPVWMAASSPDAVTWAGEEGFTIMQDPHSSIQDIQFKREMYEQALIQHGHEVGDRQIPVARLMAIAPTDDEAEMVARKGAEWTTGSYAKNPLSLQANPGEVDPIDRYVNDVILWGSPERVADELMKYESEYGMNYLLCSPLSNQTFELFNEQVLPRIT
jgi:alkanesulfonate monooxygenase SsuD/methylene tetrahydromethanopterin reductase-like flavin-dependent oxidoreductase (luciferase family)